MFTQSVASGLVLLARVLLLIWRTRRAHTLLPRLAMVLHSLDPRAEQKVSAEVRRLLAGRRS